MVYCVREYVWVVKDRFVRLFKYFGGCDVEMED